MSIERIIVYGSPIWYKDKNYLQNRKLMSIQRIPVLKMCSAFRTASSKSLNVLTNIRTIKYTIQKEIALFNLFQKGNNRKFD